MKIEKGKLKEDFNRDIYWGRLIFLSDDEKRMTKVLVFATFEYLWDYLGKNKIEENDLIKWLDEVVMKKWSVLGDALLNQDVHYDVYATTKESEATGLDYLMERI